MVLVASLFLVLFAGIFLIQTKTVEAQTLAGAFVSEIGVGSSGSEVSDLQSLLIAGEYLALSSPTGYFGLLTESALQRYQQAHGINPTGYVGPLTLAALNNASGTTGNASLIAMLTAELQTLEAELAALLGQGGGSSGGGGGGNSGYTNPPAPNPAPQTTPYYFSQSMLSQITPANLVIVRQAPCPTSNSEDNTAYAYFPITACQDQDMVSAAASTWTGGDVMHFLWENRYDGLLSRPPGPTPYPPAYKSNGDRCFIHYTSFVLAEGATNAEIAYSAGAPAHNAAGMGYLDLSEAAGFPDSAVYAHDTFAADVNTLCSGTVTDYTGTLSDVATNIVILPQGRLADVKTTPNTGFLIDYEAQDGRGNSVGHVAQEAAIAHYYGYPLSIYTNPLDGGTTDDNNFTSTTVPLIMANPNIKYFSVLVVPQTTSGSADASLTNQLTVMNGGTLPSTNASFLSKVMLTFQIGTGANSSSLADAATMHSDVLKWHIPAVDVFPGSGTTFGGQICAAQLSPLTVLATFLGLTIPC